MNDPTYVVAGNGASLAHPAPGRILASDRMVRVNNFFFEPRSHLGRRVDLAIMGGDPRVAPFMFETLWQCRATYDLRAWTSHNPLVMRAGRRRFGAAFQPFAQVDRNFTDQIAALVAQYGRKPMTGTYAVLAAYAQGAGRIVLTGMDFYTGTARYTFEAGAHHRQLLGGDVNTRGVDTRLHNTDLDLAILALVQKHSGGILGRTTQGSPLDAVMDMAPVRAGAAPQIIDTHPPTDWAPRAGLYPIALLKMLRRMRAAMTWPPK